MLSYGSRRSCTASCWVRPNDGYCNSKLFTLVNLVADGSDRNPKNFGRLRAAPAVATKRFEYEFTLNLKDRATDKIWNGAFQRMSPSQGIRWRMQKGKRISFLAMVWLHDEHHDAQLSFFNEPIIVNSVLTDWIGNFLGNYDSAFDYRIARHLYACIHQRNYG